MITRFCAFLGHSRLPPVTSDEDLKWTDHNKQWEPLLWTFQITRRTPFVHNGGNHRHLFQIDSHKIPSLQIVRCSTHMEALWTASTISPDVCCFLRWSCQISCHTQLFSSLSKSCSLDLDSWSPCHIMYRRWWPHSHYSLQPHSLTPLWQHSNDMAAGWFDGITNSSPQQKEDETRHKDVKDPCPLVCAPSRNFLFFNIFILAMPAVWLYGSQYWSVHHFGPGWNSSITDEWLFMKMYNDIHALQMMYPGELGCSMQQEACGCY